MKSPMICERCQAIYPIPLGTDYFALLGLPTTYDVDQADLRSAYRSLGRSVHPDRFTAESPDRVSLATQLSAAVNEAYRTLADPVWRADYLLTVSGGPTSSEVREVPGELLAEVMVLREELDEARAAGDGKAIERHARHVTSKRAECITRIEQAAKSLSGATDDAKRNLRLQLNSIKYWDNLLAELSTSPLSV